MDEAVQLITAEQTIDLRSRLLRPGQSIEMCRYSEDNLESTFHLGIYFENKIICNGTFIQQGHELFKDAKMPYRLRGMATDLAFQKMGLGTQIIEKALVELHHRNCDLLWFNARTSAEIFYQKLGFAQIDQVFELAGIGPHKVMYKSLSSD
jgi:predicted GNAT family N-acyltransferase